MESTRTHPAYWFIEGIVLETGARLIKWKVILTHRGKLFANIHHWKLKMAQRILDVTSTAEAAAAQSGRFSVWGKIALESTWNERPRILTRGKTEASVFLATEHLWEGYSFSSCQENCINWITTCIYNILPFIYIYCSWVQWYIKKKP